MALVAANARGQLPRELPRMRIIVDPSDDLASVARLRRLTTLSPRVLVCWLTPEARGSELARDVLVALGKDLFFRRVGRFESFWELADSWLVTRSKTELVFVCRQPPSNEEMATLLYLTRTRHLYAAERRAWIVVPSRGASPADLKRLEDFGPLGLADLENELEGLPPITPVHGQRPRSSFPVVRRDPFWTFRRRCEEELPGAEFTVVDHIFRRTALKCDRFWYRGRKRTLMLARFFYAVTASATSAHELYTRVTGLQLGMFYKGQLVDLDFDALLAHNAEPRPCFLDKHVVSKLERYLDFDPIWATAAHLATGIEPDLLPLIDTDQLSSCPPAPMVGHAFHVPADTPPHVLHPSSIDPENYRPSSATTRRRGGRRDVGQWIEQAAQELGLDVPLREAKVREVDERAMALARAAKLRVRSMGERPQCP